MASTFTTSFGIEKIGTGEQAGSWGTTTNHNADILDRIASYKAVGLSGTTHTLTVREASPGAGTENLQDGMYRVIKFTGALGANNTVTIAPNTSSAWFIFENATTDSGSSGPYSVILSQGSGANITLQNGKNAIVYCDGAGSGAAVFNALNDLQMATLEVTGAGAVDGALTVGGTTTAVAITASGLVTAGAKIDMNGTELILDADADTSITADTDDTIDFKIGGTDLFAMSTVGLAGPLTDSISAGSTQTQGGATAITTEVARVTVSGTDGDGVKLPTAVAGQKILIINDDAAQTIKIWPNTSDAIDGGSADAVDANVLGPGLSREYVASDATNSAWYWTTRQAPASVPGNTPDFTGITFGGAGSTLANYAIGTWTPAVFATGTAGTPSYNSQNGDYIRIGNIVYAMLYIDLNGWSGSPTGNLRITGLPFTASGVQLEVGSVATDFEHEDIGTTLAKCKRYLFRLEGTSTNVAIGQGYCQSSTEFRARIRLPVEMRATPTGSQSGAGATSVNVPAGRIAATGTSTSGASKYMGTLVITTAGSLTTGQGGTLEIDTTSDWVQWSAEL
jgi:hypothetical protein